MDSSLPAGTAPLYAKIADDLRDKIRDGFYGPGALLPSRNEIAASYGVSAITARDALAVLSQEGYARAIRGRGHIVRRKRPRLTVPCQLYAASGRARPGWIRRCWKCRTWRCTRRSHRTTSRCPWNRAPISSGSAAPCTPAWWTVRPSRSTSAGWPAWVMTPGRRCAPSTPAMSWPEAVQQVTGRTIATVLQNTRARGANPFEAATFAIPDATTVLVSHLTTYDAGHRPVEHSRFAWPTDAVRISAEYSYPAGADVEPQ